MALSLALNVNHSLLRLDLDREPKKELVKSFIETQKALLAEIQNGCKRNFILAKEKEEKEQKVQQSASMPEISATEPLEEGTGEDEPPTAAENGATEPAEDDDDDDDDNDGTDSDSDTDSDAGTETKEQSESPKQPNSAIPPPPSPEKTGERPPPPRGTGNPAASPVAAPSQGNERRISVSSPGRGHKIFVVTRVESLPEPREDTGAVNPEFPARQANGALPESAAGGGSDRDSVACGSAAHHDTPLLNGLKMDFARALPEVSSDGDGKMGSCGAGHGKSSGSQPPPAPKIPAGSREPFPGVSI
uniref:Uncharacterized protein n=1 Tax=Falco tinnunculus TaxID=100819 RepID=A0A8C4UCI0_FALTI